jgi:hypothetical protein
MKPKLTRPRWRALKKLEAIGDKPFIGTDVGVKGPSLVSLEECGWVERIEAPADDTPFAIATQGNHWRLTETGLAALAALPENPPRRT